MHVYALFALCMHVFALCTHVFASCVHVCACLHHVCMFVHVFASCVHVCACGCVGGEMLWRCVVRCPAEGEGRHSGRGRGRDREACPGVTSCPAGLQLYSKESHSRWYVRGDYHEK